MQQLTFRSVVGWLLVCLAQHISLPAQNVPFERENFPGRKDEFKEALRRLEVGSQFYLAGRKEFDEARRSFLVNNRYYPVSHRDHQNAGLKNFRDAMSPLGEAQKFNPRNADLNYMLGFCWFVSDPAAKEPMAFFEAAQLDGAPPEPDLAYWLGWCYHLHSRWDDAIQQYQRYLNWLMTKSRNNTPAIDDVNKKIAECQSGKKLSLIPERVFVDNLGPNINTAFAEYGPSISADEETIFFTSRRPNSTGGKKTEYDNGYYEDIYTAYRLNGAWQPAKQLSKHVNTEWHDAVAGLSPDGSRIYVYRNLGDDGGDLYESVLFGNDWEVPEHMNKNINTRFHESSVSLSFDGRHLFFVSDKTTGIGNRDIYCSELDVKGEWGVARNLGMDVNTRYAEDAVFMHPDGATLYFSSKGHNTMGGYDIFKTSFINGKWQKPENLGYPINGPDDDVFFVVSGSGNRAYFASSKPGGLGETDLYKITFLGPEKQPLLSTQDQLLAMAAQPVSNLRVEHPTESKTAKLTLLKGTVRDAKTNAPLEAAIDLFDNEKNELVATFHSNRSSGRYLVTLPSGHNYGISVKKDNYLFHSENFNLPVGADFQEFIQDIALHRIEVGNSIVLRNIFFDSDKATLRAESNNELAALVQLLKDNPSLKVELSSHTDADGSPEYNQKLSDSRSASVVAFLVTKGVAAARLTAKGYGETKPIASNSNTDGKQKNRRTEFKILEK